MELSNFMFNDQPGIYLISIFALINIISFLIMLDDKIKSSRPNASRISEGMMFFLATIFGSFGVYAGMFIFRHKTRKWYFLIGIPLLMIENLATVYAIYLFLFS